MADPESSERGGGDIWHLYRDYLCIDTIYFTENCLKIIQHFTEETLVTVHSADL